jgi:hypothetical protein
MKGRITSILILIMFLQLLAWGALTQLRQVAIFNSTVDNTVIGGTGPAAGTFTTGAFNSGITNTGSGFKHVRQTSCTTSASAGSFCATTINWPGAPFANTSYTATCVVDGGSAAFFLGEGSKTTTSMGTTIENSPGIVAAQTVTLDCIAIHD